MLLFLPYMLLSLLVFIHLFQGIKSRKSAVANLCIIAITLDLLLLILAAGWIIYTSFTAPRGEMVELDQICSSHDEGFLIVHVISIVIAFLYFKNFSKLKNIELKKTFIFSSSKFVSTVMAVFLVLTSLVGAARAVYALSYLDEGLCPI